jgi:hypothetical protein
VVKIFRTGAALVKQARSNRKFVFFKTFLTVTIIENSKGEMVVRTGHEKLHYGRGAIEIKGRKFFFKFINSPLAALLLLKKRQVR